MMLDPRLLFAREAAVWASGEALLRRMESASGGLRRTPVTGQ